MPGNTSKIKAFGAPVGFILASAAAFALAKILAQTSFMQRLSTAAGHGVALLVIWLAIPIAGLLVLLIAGLFAFGGIITVADRFRRLSAIRQAAKLLGASDSSVLQKALNSGGRADRQAALWLLSDQKSPDRNESSTIAGFLNDRDKEVALTSAKVLRAMEKRALPAVAVMYGHLETSEPQVRKDALSRIGIPERNVAAFQQAVSRRNEWSDAERKAAESVLTGIQLNARLTAKTRTRRLPP